MPREKKKQDFYKYMGKKYSLIPESRKGFICKQCAFFRGKPEACVVAPCYGGYFKEVKKIK